MQRKFANKYYIVLMVLFITKADLLIVGGILLLCFCLVYTIKIPNYEIYPRKYNEKAELKEAEWNRQIAIQEAGALKESVKLMVEAEVLRAEGIAKANEIIAGNITEEYIRYKFIEGLNNENTEVIYVPT